MSNDGMQPVKEPWFVRLADLIASRSFRRMLWCLLIAWIGLFFGIVGLFLGAQYGTGGIRGKNVTDCFITPIITLF